MREADSKGSAAPSEAGLRNNLLKIIFGVLGIMAVVLLLASLFIHFESKNNDRIKPGNPNSQSTQPQ